MKRTLVGILAGGVLAVSYVPSAEAAAFLSINVDGVIVSCDNTAALCGAGFTTVIGGNNIAFTGTVNGVSFGGGGIQGVQLVGNQPGGVTAFSTDTKTTVTNTSGVTRTVTVGFADNGYLLPAGSPISFNAAQGLDSIVSSVAVSQSFTGYGNGANTLTVGAGSASVTPICTAAASPPTDTCSTTGPVNTFVRGGAAFALSGLEVFTLVNGATVNAHGSIVATGPGVIPEPTSMLLLGSGLIYLGRSARRRLRKQ